MDSFGEKVLAGIDIDPFHTPEPRSVPAPKPVPPPFRTWEEYRAAMGRDKDRRLSHEEKMAGAPQAHAKFWKEVIVNAAEIDTAVEQEELEEEQRKVWTKEAAAKAVADAMAARTCRYVADGICRKECGKVCKFLQFDPPPAAVPAWTDDGPVYYYSEDRRDYIPDIISNFKLDFDLGCIVKYVMRAGRKPDNDFLRDLKKAQAVLKRRIEREERNSARS